MRFNNYAIRRAVQPDTERGRRYILLKCPEGLAANAFYKSLGFELVTSENSRHRKLIVWRLTLANI
jgi:hypothetical protein